MSELQPSQRLLIVARDQPQIHSIESTLEQGGYKVWVCADAEEALDLVEKEQPDIAIVDITAPSIGGVALCHRIRAVARSAISIIILGAQRDPQNRIQAIGAGADDYISQPFEIEELQASIDTLIKQQALRKKENKLKVGDIEIARDYWMVWVAGEAVELTRKEYRLLEELVASKGRVLSRDYLLESVWGYSNVPNMYTRTLEVHMARLRKKLRHANMKILTIRNVGYRINMSPE